MGVSQMAPTGVQHSKQNQVNDFLLPTRVAIQALPLGVRTRDGVVASAGVDSRGCNT